MLAKKIIVNHKNIIKNVMLIICSPFLVMIIQMFLQTILNLGLYFGTFIRCLYEIVVY